MFWLHTRTIVIFEKHRELLIANRKMFISADDKLLQLTTASFLQKLDICCYLSCKVLTAKHEDVTNTEAYNT